MVVSSFFIQSSLSVSDRIVSSTTDMSVSNVCSGAFPWFQTRSCGNSRKVLCSVSGAGTSDRFA